VGPLGVIRFDGQTDLSDSRLARIWSKSSSPVHEAVDRDVDLNALTQRRSLGGELGHRGL
jgi:hypothetical protein